MRAVLALLLATLFAVPAWAQNRVVLVAAENSPIEMLSSFEARKIYLGIAVFRNGRPIRGLRNESDPRLRDVFLQSLVGLSEESYDKRLLSNVFKFGAARPEEFADGQALLRVLRDNPYAVTYLWVSDRIPPGLKVLRVLWQDF